MDIEKFLVSDENGESSLKRRKGRKKEAVVGDKCLDYAAFTRRDTFL